MIVNFTLVQFVPGGPVEQVLAQMQGGGDVFEGFSGGGNDVAEETFGSDSDYVGARGLPKEFIEELEKEFGFDKPPLERFFNMLWNYMRLDFGESYFRSISVVDLVGKDAGVDHAGTLVHDYCLFGVHPAWHSQGGA